MTDTYVDDGAESFDDAYDDVGAEDQGAEVERQEPEEAREEPEQRQQPRGQPDRGQAEARRRREQRQARELDDMRAEIAELRRSREQPAQREQPADPFERLRSIDIDKDPLGAVEATREIAMRLQSERAETEATERQQREAAERSRKLGEWAGQREVEFIEDTPDYPKAYAHVTKARLAELKLQGYDDASAQQALNGELLQMIARCRETSRDPAEAVYKMAQARGYKLDKEGDTVQQRTQGQRGGNPLAGTGVRSGGGGVSAESVANAPRVGVRAILKGNDAFDKQFAAFKEQSRRRA